MNPVTDAPVQSGLATQVLRNHPLVVRPAVRACLGLVSGIAVYLTSVTSLCDIDLYWHLLVVAVSVWCLGFLDRHRLVVRSRSPALDLHAIGG